MSVRIMNLITWLTVLIYLVLAPVVKATDAAAPANTPPSRVTATTPKLAEQDVWLRWKLAHDRHKAARECKLKPAPASATQAAAPSRDAGKPASPDQPVK
jgi:hypothetical protein